MSRRATLATATLASVAVSALVLSVVGSAALISALGRLKDQSRIELAMDIQRQFDYDYKDDRADVARADLYPDRPRRGKKKSKKAGLEGSPYAYIMDFFDDVGYLVERGAVDDNMARRYFSYYVDNYFQATQKLLREDQKRDPDRYRHVFWLVQHWRPAEPEKPDLDAFFSDELDFAEPAPDEGPKT